jgi:hypothetical protein
MEGHSIPSNFISANERISRTEHISVTEKPMLYYVAGIYVSIHTSVT